MDLRLARPRKFKPSVGIRVDGSRTPRANVVDDLDAVAKVIARYGGRVAAVSGNIGSVVSNITRATAGRSQGLASASAPGKCGAGKACGQPRIFDVFLRLTGPGF